MKSPICMGLDDTVPAGVSPLCEAKHTGFDAYKAEHVRTRTSGLVPSARYLGLPEMLSIVL